MAEKFQNTGLSKSSKAWLREHGEGERIFEGLAGIEDRYECSEFTPSDRVSHLRIVRKS